MATCTASDWWARHARYGRSLGVSSVLGFILGLGDRHLDNILMDFSTGEVTHIDYGVCFDRGAALRVPELVPCRLTPMLIGGLGPTAVEGRFRVAAELTLGVMRNDRGLLLGLLEALVYDPLLDWSDDAAAARRARRALDTEVHLDLFAARVSELLPGVARRVSLVSSLEAPLSTLAATHLPALQQLAPQFLAACKQVSEASQRRSILANQHAKSLTAARAAAQAASEAITAAETARSRLLRGDRNQGNNDASSNSRLQLNDLAQIERLIEVCTKTKNRTQDALIMLFNNDSEGTGDDNSSSGDFCAQLETDATAAAVDIASAHPNGVFVEACTLLESTMKAMGKGNSGKGKGGGKGKDGDGWSTSSGGNSSSSSNNNAIAGKGSSNKSLPVVHQMADLRALCVSADQQRQSALDASAAALVGASSALLLYRTALCEAGLFPPWIDPRVHEAVPGRQHYHHDSIGLPSSSFTAGTRAAAAQYAGQSTHAKVLEQLQVALTRADRLTNRLAPNPTKKLSEKATPPHLSARAYAAERRFWEPLALALQQAASGPSPLSVGTAAGGSKEAKKRDQAEEAMTTILAAPERIYLAAQASARDIQLLETALRGVDPHSPAFNNETEAAAAEAAREADISLVAMRDGAASEFTRAAKSHFLPTPLPSLHDNMDHEGAGAQRTRELAGFLSGVVRSGGVQLEELKRCAWAALGSEDFERFAHEEARSRFLNVRSRQSRLMRSNSASTESSTSTMATTTNSASFGDSTAGALAIMFNPRGFETKSMEQAETIVGAAAAGDKDDDDGIETGFSVTFGNEKDEIDDENANALIAVSSGNDGEVHSSESDNEDENGGGASEAIFRYDLDAVSAAAAAARQALKDKLLAPAESSNPASAQSRLSHYLAPPATALQSACATVAATDADRHASSWFAGGVASVRPTAARQSLEATAETCHALAMAATAVQDAVVSGEQAGTIAGSDAATTTTPAASSSEDTADLVALQRSTAVASAAQQACWVAADAVEQLHAVASLGDGACTPVGVSAYDNGNWLASKAGAMAALELREALNDAMTLSEEAKKLELDVGRALRDAQEAAAAETGGFPGVQREQQKEQAQPSASAAARASGRASLDRPGAAANLATRMCRAHHRLTRALGAVESEALKTTSPLGGMARALGSAEAVVRPSLEAVLAAADGGWALRPFGNLAAQEKTGASAVGATKSDAAPFEWRWVAAGGSEGGSLGLQPTDDVRSAVDPTMPTNPVSGAAALAARAQEVVLRYLTWALMPLKLTALRAAALLAAQRELNHVAQSGNGRCGMSSGHIVDGSDTFMSLEAAVQSRVKSVAATTYAGGLVALFMGGLDQPKVTNSNNDNDEESGYDDYHQGDNKIASSPLLGLAAWAASHLAAQTAHTALNTSRVVGSPSEGQPLQPSPPQLMSSAAYSLACEAAAAAATAAEIDRSLSEDSVSLLAPWLAWVGKLESSAPRKPEEDPQSGGRLLMEAWQRMCHAEGRLTQWRRALPWAAQRLATAKQHQITAKAHFAATSWLHAKHVPGGCAPRVESLTALRSARAHLVSASEKCREADATSAKAAEAVDCLIAALGFDRTSTAGEGPTSMAAAVSGKGKGKGRGEKSASMQQFKKESAALTAWQLRAASARQQLASLASDLRPNGDGDDRNDYRDDDEDRIGFTAKLNSGSADGDASGDGSTSSVALKGQCSRRIAAGVVVAALCAFEEENEEEDGDAQQVSSPGPIVAGGAQQQQASLPLLSSSHRKNEATAAPMHLANVARAAAAAVESAAHAARQHALKVECAQAWRAHETRLKHADRERALLAKRLHHTTQKLQRHAARAAVALREAALVLFRSAKSASSDSGSSGSGQVNSSSVSAAAAVGATPASTATAFKGVSSPEGDRSAGSMAEVLALAQSLCKALGVTPATDLPKALSALGKVEVAANGDSAAAAENGQEDGGGREGPLGPLRARSAVLAAVAARAAAAEDAVASVVSQPAVAALLALLPPPLLSVDEVDADDASAEVYDDSSVEGEGRAVSAAAAVDRSSVEVLAKAADEAEAAAVAAAEAAGPTLRGAQSLVSTLSSSLRNDFSASGEASRSALLMSACVGTFSTSGGGTSGERGSFSDGDWTVTEVLLVAVVGLARDAASATRPDKSSRARKDEGEEDSGITTSTIGSSVAVSRLQGVVSKTMEIASDRTEGREEEDDEDGDDDEDDDNEDDDNDESSSDEEVEGGSKPGRASAAGEDPVEAPGGRASASATSSSAAPLLLASGGRNAHAVALLERVECRLLGGVNSPPPQKFAASPAAAPPSEKEAVLETATHRGSNVTGNSVIGSAGSLGVAAQVAWIIQQATSPENLSLMYEGWAPWI